MCKQGIVYLVGAGPGDSSLITVKGLEALRQADVILYDRLVNPLLLQEANDHVELIYCGKLPDRHILRQEAINQLLVDKAKEGKVVVRLKGGDPSVFGRVGEEAASLKQENVRYEIVPGITSGIAAASYAGIPVTHREYGTSFTVVTGHDKSVDGKPLINWKALATGIDTIAFYMGIKNLPYICKQLISNGRSSATKVAVIQWGTTGRQKVVEGTLTTISDEVAKQKISNPAITLVGNIVTLRNQLKWFEDKPLLGRKVIIPNSNENLKAQLINDGAEVLTYPKVSALPLINEPGYLLKITELAGYEELFFTSKESVQLFFESLVTNEIDVRTLKAKFYGDSLDTVRHLKEKGFNANVNDWNLLSSRILVVGTKNEVNAIQQVNDYIITHDEKTSMPSSVAFKRVLDEGGFNTIVFSSPQSINLFIDQTKKDGLEPFSIIANSQVVCIGEEAMQVAKQNNLDVHLFTSKDKSDTITELLLQVEKSSSLGV